MLNDILTIGSAIASIISLFISLGDKFPSWKKYANSASWLLGGFFIGRVSPALPLNSQLFSDGYSTGLLVVIIVGIGVVSFFAYLFNKKGEIFEARFLIIVGFMTLIPSIAHLYSDLSVSILPDDYLILVNEKEQRGEISSAIKYLEAYRSKTSSPDIYKRIDQRMEKLKNRMILDNNSKQK